MKMMKINSCSLKPIYFKRFYMMLLFKMKKKKKLLLRETVLFLLLRLWASLRFYIIIKIIVKIMNKMELW